MTECCSVEPERPARLVSEWCDTMALSPWRIEAGVRQNPACLLRIWDEAVGDHASPCCPDLQSP